MAITKRLLIHFVVLRHPLYSFNHVSWHWNFGAITSEYPSFLLQAEEELPALGIPNRAQGNGPNRLVLYAVFILLVGLLVCPERNDAVLIVI